MIRDSFYDHLLFEKRYSALTIEAYKCDLTQFEVYLDKTYDVVNENHVTYSMIRSWLASLIESGISPRSVNRKLSSLKSYFKYLLRLGYIEVNPVQVSVSLRTPVRLPSFATQKEMTRALTPNNDNTFASVRDMIVLEIFYNTGIRLAELTQLKVNDFDYYSKTIKVTGKRNKQRIIPISDHLIEKVKAYLEQGDKYRGEGVEEIIINEKGGKAGRGLIYDIVKKHLGEAGVTGLKSPHVLRHTFATHMMNEGADLNAIKEILGHSSLASTQVYTHTNIDKLKIIYEQAHPWALKRRNHES
jgi:integrase/recombinase XerC